MTDLTTTLAGVRLPSPVLVAAGCAGSGRELHRYVDLAGVALVTTPSLRLEASVGRLLPDLAPTPSGLLVDHDRSHPGVRTFCEQDLPWLAGVGARVALSASGTTVTELADVVDVARRAPGFDAVRLVELELASPRRAARGRPFAADPDVAAAAVSAVVDRLDGARPVLAKLSADAVDVVEVARECLRAGAAGVVLLAPPAAASLDLDTLRPRAGERAGLTGPAVRPLVARAVAQVRRAMDGGRVPEGAVVASGGADGPDAVVELMALGADAVQLGSTLLTDPFALAASEDGLRAHLRRLAPRLGVADPDDVAPADLVGAALRPVPALRPRAATAADVPARTDPSEEP